MVERVGGGRAMPSHTSDEPMVEEHHVVTEVVIGEPDPKGPIASLVDAFDAINTIALKIPSCDELATLLKDVETARVSLRSLEDHLNTPDDEDKV